MILNYPSPAPNDLAFLASSVVLTSSISIILHLIHDFYPSLINFLIALFSWSFSDLN